MHEILRTLAQPRLKRTLQSSPIHDWGVFFSSPLTCLGSTINFPCGPSSSFLAFSPHIGPTHSFRERGGHIRRRGIVLGKAVDVAEIDNGGEMLHQHRLAAAGGSVAFPSGLV